MHKSILNITLKIVLVVSISLLLSGCGIGTCIIDCTSKEYGNRSVHGPYDNYTKAECEEKIQYTETILTDCSWEWEAY